LLYIIIFIILITVTIIVPKRVNYVLAENINIVGSAATGIVFFIVIFMVSYGIYLYPQLKAKDVEITTLRKNVTLIKNAYYKSDKNSKNTIINGSVENFQQSTNLSKYLIEISNKEAEYLSNLELAKIYKHSKLFNIIGYGMFISDEIDNLPTY